MCVHPLGLGSKGLTSSQVAQRAANSQFPLNSSALLIGQLYFHSTSFPLHPNIVCFPVGRMENEECEGKENSSRKMLLENVLLLT